MVSARRMQIGGFVEPIENPLSASARLSIVSGLLAVISSALRYTVSASSERLSSRKQVPRLFQASAKLGCNSMGAAVILLAVGEALEALQRVAAVAVGPGRNWRSCAIARP